MTSLVRALHAESLKLRRTLALRMALVAPLLVAGLQFMIVWERKIDAQFRMWDLLGEVATSAWAVFLYPLLIALETALIGGLEHAEKSWKHLFSLPIPRSSVYLAKLLFALALALASTLLLGALSLLAGIALMRLRPELAAAGAPPYGWFLKQALLMWLASWLIVAIHAWIGMRWPGFTLAVGAGVAGTFFAIFLSRSRFAGFYPWLFPLNVLSAAGTAKALALGVGGGLLAAALGCFAFVRRDVV